MTAAGQHAPSTTVPELQHMLRQFAESFPEPAAVWGLAHPHGAWLHWRGEGVGGPRDDGA